MEELNPDYNMVSANEVTERLNNAMQKLYVRDPGTENYRPPVCLVCDQFTGEHWKAIKPEILHKAKKRFEPETKNLPLDIQQYYQYSGKGHSRWMNKQLLSPRGCYIEPDTYDEFPSGGFVVCSECCKGIEMTHGVKYCSKAIGNGWTFGEAPEELTCLTEAELSILTPTRTFGYCYTYVGGTNKKLQGTLGFYKVSQAGLQRVAQLGCELKAILGRKTVFITHGYMTDDQKRRVLQKKEVRPEKLKSAIKWLIANNPLWSHLNPDEVDASEFPEPEHVDMSEPAPSGSDDPNNEPGAADNEKEDTFHVYFPDKTMTNISGGMNSSAEFRRLVRAAQAQGWNGEIIADMNVHFTSDYIENNFALSCVLQMPYGYGGMKDTRKYFGKDRVTKVSEYAQHLSYMSLPVFHKPTFQLMLYNMFVRGNILQTTRSRLHGNRSLQNLRNDLDIIDLKAAAEAKTRHGYANVGTKESREVLKNLDAVAGNLPHSDQAAKRARQWMNAMSYSFGLAGFFLTVTPDDENSFLITLYSQMDKNGNRIDIDELSNKELKDRAAMRRDTRLQFPGITSLNFMYCLDIIVREVIGWDMEECRPTGQGGLFGDCAGFGGAVEEQGRTTLHVHLIIFLPGYQTYMDNMSSNNSRVKENAEKYVQKLSDNTISTQIIDVADNRNPAREILMFSDHKCTTPINKRNPPRVVDDQEIRNLRHRTYHAKSTTLMYCEHCTQKWSSEAFVQAYLRNGLGIQRIETVPSNNKYLENAVYEYTKPGFPRCQIIKPLVHVKNDLHATKHAKSCFKCAFATASKKIWNKDECRMRLPCTCRTNVCVVPMFPRQDESNEIPYFTWSGDRTTKQYFTVLPKRNAYDAFGNAHIPAISDSMIGGNTNGRIMSPGPSALYTTKYPMKDNQQQQEQPYEPVVQGLTKMLNHPQRQEVDKYESLRMLTAAGFLQNKANVVGAPMASFLLRRRTRFLFSHKFAFVPVNDVKSLLMTGEVTKPFIRFYRKKPYADVMALNYLCRPMEFESFNLMQFVTRTTVKKFEKGDAGRGHCYEFMEKGPGCAFDHSTADMKRGKKGLWRNLQAVEEYSGPPKLPWLPDWVLRDTATLGGDMMTCPDHQISQEMEEHAFSVLCLFAPCRRLEDIQREGSFVLYLREFRNSDKWTPTVERYLQNVQDVVGNYGRVHPSGDELQSRTKPYQDDTRDKPTNDDDEDDHANVLQGTDLDNYWDEVLREIDGDDDPTSPEAGKRDVEYMPCNISFTNLRDKGGHKCGRERVCRSDKYNISSDTNSPNIPLRSTKFLQKNTRGGLNFDASADDAIPQMNDPSYPSRDDVIHIVLTKKGTGEPRRFAFFNDERDDQAFPEASGSAESIIEWSRLSGIDAEQRRAFEVFASSFILSFYRDALLDEDTSAGLRDQNYLRHRNSLLKLSGRVSVNLTDDALSRAADRAIYQNTRCFLHGPGGSGKSAVLEMLSSYCEEFCSFVGEDFNRYTILNTAFSGVAATMINGRTVHSACHVNKELTNIPMEDKENWRHTRLLIMDEISFASTNDLEKVNTRCQVLKDNMNALYGGIDVIFCGDMRQLEPIGNGATTLYETNDCPAFHGAINCYIELHGRHRFKNDPEWGELLARLREGEMTEDDVDRINSRKAMSDADVPRNVSYATYRNTDRTSIHCGVFENYALEHKDAHGNLDEAVVIFSSKLELRTGDRTFSPVQNKWENYFFQQCGEGDCNSSDFHHSRFDPALVLYPGRPVMLNTNRMFALNVANGTRAIIERIILKEERDYGVVNLGFVRIKSARAHNIDRVVLRKEGTDDYFEVGPRLHHFQANIPTPETLISTGYSKKKEKVAMRGYQLPLVCNNATTCHKLQGASINKLFIHCWSSVRNWVYVVLSRVRTIEGLTTRLRLEKGEFLHKLNEIPSGLKRMIKDFRQCHQRKALNEAEYDSIIV